MEREYKPCGCVQSTNTWKLVFCKKHRDQVTEADIKEVNDLLSEGKQVLDAVTKECIRVREQYDKGLITDEQWFKFLHDLEKRRDNLKGMIDDTNQQLDD